MEQEFLSERRKALEESFFAKRNQELLELLKQEVSKADRRRALQEACGISDDTVLDELLSLNIAPETLAALKLIPLIEVAWADGHLEDRERAAVLAAADAAGVATHTPCRQLLEEWLKSSPSPQLIRAWQNYLSALLPSLDEATRKALRDELLGRARGVAESAGGILGLHTISAAERARLEELEQAFA